MVNIYDVYKYLPKKNCGKCGFSTCMLFASKLLKREVGLRMCPYLKMPEYRRSLQSLISALKPIYEAEETGIVIDEKACNGCGNCVVICPANAKVDLDLSAGLGPENQDIVLMVRGGKAKIVNLKLCYRNDPSKGGCKSCADACPLNAITFV